MMKWFLLLPAAMVLAGCVTPTDGSAEERYFSREVKPVLQQHCLRCHNCVQPSAALNLTSKATAFRNGTGGRPFIVPGKPDSSLLITAIQRGGMHSKLMPRADISLTDDQIGALREWIEDGAFWPEGTTGALRHESTGENR